MSPLWGALIGGLAGVAAGLVFGFGTAAGAMIGVVVGAFGGFLVGSPSVPAPPAPSPRTEAGRSGGTETAPSSEERPGPPVTTTPWKKGQVLTALGGDVLRITDIKQGGMGYVLICYGEQRGRALACKTFKPEKMEPDKFRREAENWVQLGRHPNVVRAHAVIEHNQQLFVATELVPSHPRLGVTDLDGWIRRGAIDRALALDLAVQICLAMEHAAACFPNGFVHRDLKPQNVLIHPDGRAMVTDFGIAQALPPDGALTGVGGTPAYGSPEQWTRDAAIDVRSDIYSFGCVFVEMLTGRRVFPGAAGPAAIHAHRSETPQLPGLPEELASIALKCLRKAPEERYASFRDVRGAIEAVSRPARVPAPATETAQSLVNRAHDLLVLGKPQEALELANRAMEMDPSDATAWINRGAARGMLGDLPGEIDDLTRAIAIEPRSYAAYRNRAKAYLKIGDFEAALADFEKSHEILPPGADPSKGPKDVANDAFEIGFIKLVEGDAAGAEQSFGDALKHQPDHPEAQTMRSQARLARGDAAGAMRDLDEAIALHPKSAVAYSFRAHVRNQIGEFREAVDDASRAIELDPSFPQALNNRAAAKFNLRDYKGCVADCDASIKLWPDLSMPHLNRANALLELGRRAEAAEGYEKALSLGVPPPWDEVARAALRL